MQKKGVISILLTVIILSGILSIGLAVSGWTIIGLKLSRGTGFSAPSYYAAESGVEFVLYNAIDEDRRPLNASSLEIVQNLNNNTKFTIDILSDAPLKARSLGEFMDVRRTIEINWNNSSW